MENVQVNIGKRCIGKYWYFEYYIAKMEIADRQDIKYKFMTRL